FYLRDARQQDAGSRDEVTARLHPQLQLRIRPLEAGEGGRNVGNVQLRRALPLGDAEPAADIQILYIRKAIRQRGEEDRRLGPGLRRDDAAPDVRVQADDPRRRRRDQPIQPLQLLRRNAELALRTGRPHIFVMAVPPTGVDPNDELPPLEYLRPGLQRIQIVERHEHASLESRHVFFPGREIRREEDAPPVDLRKQLEDEMDLPGRDALEPDTGIVEDAEHLRIRIRLHRVEHAVERGDRLHLVDRLTDTRLIVDVDGRIFLGDA